MEEEECKVTKQMLIEGLIKFAEEGMSRQQVADKLGVGEWRVRKVFPELPPETQELLTENGKRNQREKRWGGPKFGRP